MIEPLLNCFRIPELRKKIFFTVFMLGVFRIGAFIPVPGVDSKAVGAAAGQLGGGALGLVDMFSGGALSNVAVFGLGIMPYISASIVFQLLATVIKPLEELQKEGEAGQKKINQYTRYATVLLCFVQGFFMARMVKGIEISKGVYVVPSGVREGFSFELICIISLTAGTLFVMWLGEQIQEHGIGNGISLLIMGGIVARMPPTIVDLFKTQVDPNLFNPAADKIGIIGIVGMMAMYVLVVVGVVLLNQGQRRVTIQTAKQIKGRRVFGGQRYYLPLKVGAAGVIPIIFAQSLLMFPQMLFGKLAASASGFWGWLWYSLAALFNMQSMSYLVIYVALIMFFAFFWTAVQFNPIKMAEDMKEHGNFIPGIRPGKRTSEYFERVMTRITLAGAAFIAVIAILPYLIQRNNPGLGRAAYIYGGTGILIVVGVALDLVQKIENHLLMRHYDGFLKGGARIRGRQS